MRKNALLAGFCLILVGSFYIGLPRAAAQCTAADGTINNSGDTITCNSTNTPLVAGTGNDVITVQTGAIVTDSGTSTLQTINGGNGNDTIINNGTVIGTNTGFMGNGLDGGSGTNTIINNGTISVDGTNAAGIRNGIGLVTNNNSITSTGGGGDFGIWSGASGNSTVINNGQVAGVTVGISGWAFNDTIILNGNSTTSGTTAVDASAGNDTVTVAIGATVNGVLNGNSGTADRLIFQLDGDQSSLDAFNAYLIANNITVTSGALNFGGKSYTWINFEQLQFLLNLIVNGQSLPAGDAAPVQTGVQAICEGAVKVFRQSNGDLDVYSGFDALPPNGFLVGRITTGETAAGITRFQDAGIAAQQGWFVEITRQADGKLIIQVFDGQGNPVGNSCTA